MRELSLTTFDSITVPSAVGQLALSRILEIIEYPHTRGAPPVSIAASPRTRRRSCYLTENDGVAARSPVTTAPSLSRSPVNTTR